MGWWKVKSTGQLIGDGPLDALGAACDKVVAEYQKQFGRRPTVGEWEALLFAVLGNPMPEYAMFDGRPVKSVRIELEPEKTA